MLELSDKARELIAQNKIDLQLIVEIDEIDLFFGVTPVRTLWKIDNNRIRVDDPGLFVDGTVMDPNSKDVIDPTASTKSISQQLEIEKGVSSVSSIKVRIGDFQGIATTLFSPTATTDILGRGCTVYVGFKAGSHPEDSIRIFDGLIDDCTFGPTFADLNISHPEQFKRQAIFPKWEGEIKNALSANRNAGETAQTPDPVVLGLNSMDGLLEMPNTHGFYNYFKLDTELVRFQFVDFAQNRLLVLKERSAFDTDRLNHAIDDSIESFYFINAHPIDLTLMLLCSNKAGESDFYASGLRASSVEILTTGDYRLRIRALRSEVIKYNLQIEDMITLERDGQGSYPANNLDRLIIISAIEFTDTEALIYSNTANLVNDAVNPYTFKATSRWNVLPDGCGIPNRYIDFEEFARIKSLHASELAKAEIFLKDTVEDAKEFIDQVVLRPQGLYTLPRKGRISIGKTSPPIATKETKTLNNKNVLNAKDIQIKRTINRNFYNGVIYKYQEDPTEDRFNLNVVNIDSQSFQRIKVGNRPLIVEARSLRKSDDTTKVITTQTKRLLERYKFAAEFIPSVVVDFETGINIDIGDTVIADFKKLSVADITSGSRDFDPRLMEVTNKELNITQGKISLELTSTIFEVDGRYATISPSSTVKGISGTGVILLEKSFSRRNEPNEKGKWDQYIGQKIIVRSPDWTVVLNGLIGALSTNSDGLEITGLSSSPLPGYIIESPKYDDSSGSSMNFWKRVHAYVNPTVKVLDQISPTVIQVHSADIGKFRVGAVLFVHKPDYSSRSPEVTVKELNETTHQISVSAQLGYTVTNDDLIELIGFKDKGLPYRIV